MPKVMLLLADQIIIFETTIYLLRIIILSSIPGICHHRGDVMYLSINGIKLSYQGFLRKMKYSCLSRLAFPGDN